MLGRSGRGTRWKRRKSRSWTGSRQSRQSRSRWISTSVERRVYEGRSRRARAPVRGVEEGRRVGRREGLRRKVVERDPSAGGHGTGQGKDGGKGSDLAGPQGGGREFSMVLGGYGGDG
jgi:hypothetical protein